MPFGLPIDLMAALPGVEAYLASAGRIFEWEGAEVSSGFVLRVVGFVPSILGRVLGEAICPSPPEARCRHSYCRLSHLEQTCSGSRSRQALGQVEEAVAFQHASMWCHSAFVRLDLLLVNVLRPQFAAPAFGTVALRRPPCIRLCLVGIVGFVKKSEGGVFKECQGRCNCRT